MTTAVVFAYHDVGVRCLSVLIDQDVDVPLVVTHEDDPKEALWFGSVSALARAHGLPLSTPQKRRLPDLAERVSSLAPDFVFSFYYRYLLPRSILELPRLGAYNMHGSLLPRYRGRAPVNWAILNGERVTGASLHVMTESPDAGDLVDQMEVPILIDDTAVDVMGKVTCAAEIVLARSLPALREGRAPRRPLDLTQGRYYGRRRPDDGRIDWQQPARRVHDLVRAVAPPYPGAFSELAVGRLEVHRTRLDRLPARHDVPVLYAEDGRLYADCGDGRRLDVLKCTLSGEPYDACLHRKRWGDRVLPLGETTV
jgi:methionyl-tRNA formyltransferase